MEYQLILPSLHSGQTFHNKVTQTEPIKGSTKTAMKTCQINSGNHTEKAQHKTTGHKKQQE